MRLSGLQKEVLALYRSCLRESRKKPASTRAHFEQFARSEFDRNLRIEKRDFAAIEFLLRKGRRQLDVYSNPGIKDSSQLNPTAPPLSLSTFPGRAMFRAPASTKAASWTRSSVGNVASTVLPPSCSLAEMVPLASIPEANNSLQSTFDTHRPRSRVVFLSRRPGRPRCSVRKSPFTKLFNLGPPKHVGKQDHLRDKDRQGHKDASPSTLGKIGASPTWIKTSSDVSPNIRQQLHKSESPFDLSSFPEPPSSSKVVESGKPSPHPSTHPVIQRAAPKPPLELSQRRLLVPAQRRPANIRHSLMDAATDFVSPSKRQSVDSALVAAVSRSIAQQLQLVSKYSGRNSPHNDNASRTSSQRYALNGFTRDLEAYANQICAKGKTVNTTPTPPIDAATLHTVSELLPFRPQLRAAGLAVTSKEQAQGVPHYLQQLQPGLPPPPLRRQRGHGRPPAQLDGYNGSRPSQSTGTEISFAQSQDIDEFRYALIDEVPPRKKKHRLRKKRPTRRCLPCFPVEEDLTTDPDWAHFRVPSARPKVLEKKPVKELRQNRPVKVHSPAYLAQEYVGSDRHSPYQKSTAQEVGSTAVDETTYQWDRPNFITTGRRHSMTMPKPKARNEECYVGHRHMHGRDSQHRVGKNSTAVLNNNNNNTLYTGNGVRNSRQVGRVPKIEPQLTMAAKPSQPQHNQQVETQFDGQANGQQKRGTDVDPRPPRQRPPQTRRSQKKQPVSQYDSRHIGICCPSSRGVPAKLTARPNIPRRSSSIQGSAESIEVDYDDREISDRDVLRGLHVAASAACNEEIDAFVRNKTGLRIRRFLADLMALETLTASRPGEDGEQHARRRRMEMRKLKQQVRRSREIVMAGGLI
ncbi:heat repeat protein, partial [Metarhizium hybridum]